MFPPLILSTNNSFSSLWVFLKEKPVFNITASLCICSSVDSSPHTPQTLFLIRFLNDFLICQIGQTYLNTTANDFLLEMFCVFGFHSISFLVGLFIYLTSDFLLCSGQSNKVLWITQLDDKQYRHGACPLRAYAVCCLYFRLCLFDYLDAASSFKYIFRYCQPVGFHPLPSFSFHVVCKMNLAKSSPTCVPCVFMTLTSVMSYNSIFLNAYFLSSVSNFSE